jgi:hypothetical protein
MKNLLRRLDRLEKQLIRAPILLIMSDGSTERLLGDANYMLDLMIDTLDGKISPELELIAHSMSSEEPGGAHMVDMARLLYGARKRQLQPGEDEPGR